MNIETRIDRQQGLRTHVLRGENSLSDIQAFLAQLFYAEDFDPAYPALWDVREAVFPTVSQIEVRELAYFLRDHWAAKYQRRMAVVAAGDFLFGLSRMLEQFTGPAAHEKFKTFRELPPAIEWLKGQPTTAPYPARD